MLDISRSMSKAYADLVSNFLSSLTNLVLLRRDAYLCHAHPNLDAFRVRNLHAAPVSGGDLFERNLMQEYEQHLIGLGVKPGSKKEQRFHPYKKNKRGRGGRQQAQQGVYYQPVPAPQYMVQQPFFLPPSQGGRRGGRGCRRGHGRGGSTSGTKQQQPPQWHSIPSATFKKPWVRTDNAFRRSLTLCFPCNPSRRGKDSECVNPKGAFINWCNTRERFQEAMPLQPLDLSLWKLSRRRVRFSSLLTLIGVFPSLSAMADL